MEVLLVLSIALMNLVTAIMATRNSRELSLVFAPSDVLSKRMANERVATLECVPDP